jgi:hypothetical protein
MSFGAPSPGRPRDERRSADPCRAGSRRATRAGGDARAILHGQGARASRPRRSHTPVLREPRHARPLSGTPGRACSSRRGEQLPHRVRAVCVQHHASPPLRSPARASTPRAQRSSLMAGRRPTA